MITSIGIRVRTIHLKKQTRTCEHHMETNLKNLMDESLISHSFDRGEFHFVHSSQPKKMIFDRLH